MFESGLFINDLSLHDNSRDLVLAGTQTSAELKLALDQVDLIWGEPGNITTRLTFVGASEKQEAGRQHAQIG